MTRKNTSTYTLRIILKCVTVIFNRVIRLKNGLTACLISDVTNIEAHQSLVSDSSDSEYETESEYESESGTSASEPEVADHDDSKMKKVSTSEQKMVGTTSIDENKYH